MKSKAGSLRKKILLAKLSKRDKDSVQIKKSINENEDIRAGTEEIKKILSLISKVCITQNRKM